MGGGAGRRQIGHYLFSQRSEYQAGQSDRRYLGRSRSRQDRDRDGVGDGDGVGDRVGDRDRVGDGVGVPII